MVFELRIAWRETRPVLKRFVFMVAGIAVGVGALTGIKGFSQALEHAISRSAKDLIASDLAVRFNSAPSQADLDALESLEKRGAVMTRVTETLSMASTPEGGIPLLSTIRGVDPRFYPFYGDVELDPQRPLQAVLDDGSAVVSQDFLVRTGSSLGNRVQIGTRTFQIAAVLKSEPDRIASGLDLGPRILITRSGLQNSGLLQFGSRAAESFLYRLPYAGLDLEQAEGIIRGAISGRARIVDYRNPNPSVSRGIERTANYLSLIGFLALIVAGVGVATTIHSYLLQKLDHIAVMKCIGGRSSQIIRIYLTQGMLISAAGSLIGVGFGYLLQRIFASLLQGLFRLPTRLEIAPEVAIQGLLIGIAASLLFLLPPLLVIRKIRPARVFLRDMPETRTTFFQRLRHDPVPLACSMVLLAGVGLLASWLAHSFRWGFTFLGGFAGAILVLASAARILLTVLKRAPRSSSLALRHGIKNLNRPGSHVAPVLVALGIGTAFILTVYFIQTSLLSQIVKGAPADFPNVFLIGVTERDQAPLWSFLKDQPGLIDAGVPIPAIPSRLRSVDGKSVDQLGLEANARNYLRHEFTLTWSAAVPPDTRLIEGQWWKAPFQEPMISVGERAAGSLKLQIGNILEFQAAGKILRGRVVNIRSTEFDRPGTNNQFIFSPGALKDFPASYVGAIRMMPAEVARFQKTLFSRFPNITSIDIGQVLVRVQELLDKISTVIRFIAFLAIVAGLTLLASSVAATRHQRIREAMILRTLGATRTQVARIQAVEFLVIGLAAGLLGGLLAAVTSHFLLGRLLNTDFEFRWLPFLSGTLGTAALAITTGWIACRGVMNHKPLEVLREN
jgi:putative ABC transport system permease protein